MKKKLISVLLSAAMATTMLAGCGSTAADTGAAPAETKATEEKTEAADTEAETGTEEAAATGEGKVYYLNFKPEQADDWVDLAAEYTAETGVPVTVVTAASGTYESTLKSEMAKTEAPTLFQVNGPVGLASWKDYCYDLSGSDIYSQLTSDAYTVKDGDAVDGIAYVIESYGLIVNKTLLEKAGYTVDDIKSFDDLKKVADDIQARKDELGVKGAFTSAGMDGSSDWRFKTHLANLPIYYEYKADGIDDTEAIKGTYLDQYKNVFDLYITDSTCDGSELSAKTADDSRNEFVNGDAVFYQNGSWEYGELSKTYSDDELAMIPIYFGVDDENEGLATGTENFWCVNKEASEEDIQATLDFMNWWYTSDYGKAWFTDVAGVVPPIKSDVQSNFEIIKQGDELAEAGLIDEIE